MKTNTGIFIMLILTLMLNACKKDGVKGDKPTVDPPEVNDVLLASVTISGKVNPNSSETMTSVDYGLTTAYGYNSPATENPLTGESFKRITVSLTELTAGTTYHFRIKAENKLGITYSEDMSFTTYAVADVDNNLYQSVTIGNQTWLKSNLMTTHFSDNSAIQLVSDNSEWSLLSTPGYSWYENDKSTYGKDYGALYNWYAISTGKICPAGWHVPSNQDWTNLIDFLGGADTAGAMMKETGTSHWFEPNNHATNESGFTCLAAGDRRDDGAFGNLLQSACIWHSDEYESWGGQVTYIQYWATAYNMPFNKESGASVRCIKDK